MKWSFEWDGVDCVIYDHRGDEVTTAINSDPPSKRLGSDGIPKNPDVRGAILDYLIEQLNEDIQNDNQPASAYTIRSLLYIAAGRIEERESE